MTFRATRWLAGLCIVLATAAGSIQAHAADTLKVINNPGGGQIIYGPMDSQRSVQAALGYMLRQVHGHYGDRPQVGKLLQDRSGQSLGAFFNLTAKNYGGQHISGLVMVNVPRNGQATAAVMTDDAQRFPKTINPMLQRINSEWKASAPPSSSAGNQNPAPVGAAPQLQQVRFPDGSGSIGLPPGWQLTRAHGGACEAHGPNGEGVSFGIRTPVMDPTNPRANYQLNRETQGGRLPLPGMYIAVPYSMDPGQAYISACAQLAQKQRRTPPSIRIIKVTQSQSQNGASVYVLQAEVDAHNGHGIMSDVIQLFRRAPFDAQGNWAMTFFEVAVPKALAEQESATIPAIFKSYNMNQQVVVGEIQQGIKLNTENTNAVLARARASQQNFDQKLANDRANEDARDKVNQGFANILLDQTVVRDSENHERGTVYNDYADALVKSNPNRFQYVPTQDYMKGIDY